MVIKQIRRKLQSKSLAKVGLKMKQLAVEKTMQRHLLRNLWVTQGSIGERERERLSAGCIRTAKQHSGASIKFQSLIGRVNRERRSFIPGSFHLWPRPALCRFRSPTCNPNRATKLFCLQPYDVVCERERPHKHALLWEIGRKGG
jgi:hypothetical protein